MDGFQFLNDKEFAASIYADKDLHNNYLKCDNCNIAMSIDNEKGRYICDNCGFNGDAVCDGVSILSSRNYNTSDTSASRIRFIGPDSHACQKNLLAHTSEQKKSQKIAIEKQYRQLIRQDHSNLIPDNIIKAATNMFAKIACHHILRGPIRKGVMAVCLDIICQEQEKMIKAKIIKIMDISDQKFTKGMRLMDQYKAEGIITITPKIDQIDNLVNQYFVNLSLNEILSHEQIIRYKKFVSILVRFASKKKIAISSMTSSKCVGGIHIVCICAQLNINNDTISKYCSISKTTFQKFTADIFNILRNNKNENYAVLSILFKKCGFDIETVLSSYKKNKRKKTKSDNISTETVNFTA